MVAKKLKYSLISYMPILSVHVAEPQRRPKQPDPCEGGNRSGARELAYRCTHTGQSAVRACAAQGWFPLTLHLKRAHQVGLLQPTDRLQGTPVIPPPTHLRPSLHLPEIRSTFSTHIRGVITLLFSVVGTGVSFTSNKLEFELLELDPQLEYTSSLELAPRGGLVLIKGMIDPLKSHHSWQGAFTCFEIVLTKRTFYSIHL